MHGVYKGCEKKCHQNYVIIWYLLEIVYIYTETLHESTTAFLSAIEKFLTLAFRWNTCLQDTFTEWPILRAPLNGPKPKAGRT